MTTETTLTSEKLISLGFELSAFETWNGEDDFYQKEYDDGWLIVAADEGSFAIYDGEDDIAFNNCLKNELELRNLWYLLTGTEL